jgi:hypothetical protein
VAAGCQREPFAKQLPRGGTLRRNYLGLTVYSPKGLSDRRMPTPDALEKFNVKTGDSTGCPCVSSRPMAHGARHTVKGPVACRDVLEVDSAERSVFLLPFGGR